MRLLFTIPLTLVFVVVFAGFFLLDSVARYSSDADAFVETAREAKVRETLIDVTEELIYGELRKDPNLQQVSRAELSAMIEGVITEAWLDASIRAAHAATMSALDEAKESAVIDLRKTKLELHEAMAELERLAGEACVQFMGADACADADQAAYLLKLARARGDHAIDRIEDEVDIVAELTGKDGRGKAAEVAELETVKKRLGDIRTLRWVGLGILIVCLALIAWINGDPLARLLRATGLALVLGAGLYLVTVSATSDYVREQAGEHIAGVRERHSQLDRVDRALAEGSERFTVELVARSTRQSTTPVLLLGLVGLIALGGGFFYRR
jgi:hypothetical protein